MDHSPLIGNLYIKSYNALKEDAQFFNNRIPKLSKEELVTEIQQFNEKIEAFKQIQPPSTEEARVRDRELTKIIEKIDSTIQGNSGMQHQQTFAQDRFNRELIQERYEMTQNIGRKMMVAQDLHFHAANLIHQHGEAVTKIDAFTDQSYWNTQLAKDQIVQNSRTHARNKKILLAFLFVVGVLTIFLFVLTIIKLI